MVIPRIIMAAWLSINDFPKTRIIRKGGLVRAGPESCADQWEGGKSKKWHQTSKAFYGSYLQRSNCICNVHCTITLYSVHSANHTLSQHFCCLPRQKLALLCQLQLHWGYQEYIGANSLESGIHIPHCLTRYGKGKLSVYIDHSHLGSVRVRELPWILGYLDSKYKN